MMTMVMMMMMIKTLLLQRCDVFFAYVSRDWWSKHAWSDNDRVIEGPNARDQIAFCTFHSFFMEVQTKLAT